MKIIRRGVLPENKVYEGACMRCGTLFEFEKHEAVLKNEGCKTYLTIDCPVCKNTVVTVDRPKLNLPKHPKK